jgi:hypothetical protein
LIQSFVFRTKNIITANRTLKSSGMAELGYAAIVHPINLGSNFGIDRKIFLILSLSHLNSKIKRSVMHTSVLLELYNKVQNSSQRKTLYINFIYVSFGYYTGLNSVPFKVLSPILSSISILIS